MKLNTAMGRARGVTLLEMLIALVVMASVAVGVAQLSSKAGEDAEISVVAAHTRAVGDAANAYIKDNYSAIAAIATATQPVLIRVQDLVAAGNLQPGFSVTNGRGQATCVLVLQPTAYKLNGLVVTEGGEAFDDLALAQLAATIGGAGGAIYSTDPSTVRGAIGGYEFSIGAFANSNHLAQRCDGTGGTVAMTQGHAAMALWYADGPGNESTLYRDEVPGNPQLNTMNTPILMGAATVRVEKDACTVNGAVARDAIGRVLACVSGEWMVGGSAFWQDAVPTYAALPVCDASAKSHTRVVESPSAIAGPLPNTGPRAYTCDGMGTWAAIGLNDMGDFVIPGVATLTELNGDLRITSVATAGDACSANGRMAVDSTGMALFCQSSVWTSTKGGSIPSMYVITSSGMFTIPAETCKYTIVGGGGGGATILEGAAGGGGGAAIGVLENLTVGQTISVIVGAGGAPTGYGGTSSINSGSQAIPYIYATGGASGNSNWTGYPGGLGFNGQLNLRGGPGESYGRQVGYPVGGNSIYGGGGSSGSGGLGYGGGGSWSRWGAAGVVVFEC